MKKILSLLISFAAIFTLSCSWPDNIAAGQAPQPALLIDFSSSAEVNWAEVFLAESSNGCTGSYNADEDAFMIDVAPGATPYFLFLNKNAEQTFMKDTNFIVINAKRINSESVSSNDKMALTVEAPEFTGGKFNNMLTFSDSYKPQIAEMNEAGVVLPDQYAWVFKLFPIGDSKADLVGGTKLYIKSIAVFTNREDAEAYAGATPAEPIEITERMFNGMGEVDLLHIARNNFPGVNIDQTMHLIEAMNIGTYRLGMHMVGTLNDPETIRTVANFGEDPRNEYKAIIEMLNDAGVELIIGLCHSWFLPGENGGVEVETYAIPPIDYTEGSDYMVFLDMFRKTWETMSGAFPEIQYWQIANETNNDGFFIKRQKDRQSPDDIYFTEQEKATITLDMTYYATQGIRKGNPLAKVIMPGIAPLEGGTIYGAISRFLNLLYDGIENGQTASGSRNPDDYFQALAWHPYTFGDIPDSAWVAENQNIYNIGAARHGRDLPVFLTEFGFTHNGGTEAIRRANDERYAEYLRIAFNLIQNEMDFVTSVMAFRQYEESSLADKGEAYYGFFSIADGYITPNHKGRAICDIYGGDSGENALLKYADPDWDNVPDPPEPYPAKDAYAAYGSPNINLETPDSLWNSATAIGELHSKNTGRVTDADAVVKAMWDESFLYVMADISDCDMYATTDVGNYANDSFEVYLDFLNNKYEGYDANCAKINVDLLNRLDKGSFRAAVEHSVFVKSNNSGYYVYMAIPWVSAVMPVEANTTIGFDVQLSDRLSGTSERDAYKGWNDYSDNVWQSAFYMGNLHLLAFAEPEPVPTPAPVQLCQGQKNSKQWGKSNTAAAPRSGGKNGMHWQSIDLY